LEQTCKDFGVEFGMQSWMDTVRGFGLALRRTEPLKGCNRVRLEEGTTDRLVSVEVAGED